MLGKKQQNSNISAAKAENSLLPLTNFLDKKLYFVKIKNMLVQNNLQNFIKQTIYSYVLRKGISLSFED